MFGRNLKWLGAAAIALAGPAPGLAQRAEQWPMETPRGAVAAQLAKVKQGVGAGPFKSDWDSLRAYRTPEWFRDAKFGIFIHWGVYSVPGFANEWYSRNMYVPGNKAYEHHRKTYGPQDKFGYKDFIPLFRAEKFDPAAWVKLFADAGARLPCRRQYARHRSPMRDEWRVRGRDDRATNRSV